MARGDRDAGGIIAPSAGGKRGGRYDPAAFARHASLGLAATGIIFLVATLLDFGVLWIAQRQPGPDWEFVALTRTVEGFPRLLIGLGFLFGAVWVRGTAGLGAYRALGISLLILALFTAAIGALLLMSYLTLRGNVTPESGVPFHTTAVKGLALSALYVVTLVPVGLLVTRRPAP